MTGPAGGFHVDRAAAPQAVEELRQAAAELRAIQKEAERLGNVVPPSADEVSHDAAVMLGGAAAGRPGSFSEALKAGIQQLDEHIRNMEAALADYGSSDETAAADFSR